ncbi:hypothetical protein MHI39_18825 [Heyndrickxia sp. FSL K6-6286]|uniref:hypothetical protein n=1 Tax=Heyndrickxia sp. FSL K6-6286 TaxID=2921510 RepID=UPI00315A8E79
MRFVDDLAGAIFDIFKFIVRSISYLLAGMIIVAVPMYMIAWVFGLFQYSYQGDASLKIPINMCWTATK